jgi:hypothetical protein
VASKLKAFVDAYREKKATYVLPDVIGNTTRGDFEGYADPEKIDPSQTVEERTGDTEADPVLTIDGVLDFLGDVSEEVLEWIEREGGLGHVPAEAGYKPQTLKTYECGSDNWKANRFAVDRAVQLLRIADNRKEATIVNYGPEVVRISSSNPGGSGVNPGSFSVPVSNPTVAGQWYPVRLPTCADVWATPTTLNTASVVEVMDFWGQPS